MTKFLLRVSVIGLWASLTLARAQGLLPNPVFAYEFGPVTPEQQATLAAKNGFAGTVFDGTNEVPQRLAALDNQHEQLFYLWLTVDVSDGKIAYEPGTEQAIRDLNGRSTIVWLAVKGSGEGAETRAVAAVRRVSDLASASNLRVALYPHFGFLLARFNDVVRVAESAARSNVGVTLNLCHELRAGWDTNVPALLERALPLIYGVTINGADRKGSDWSTLIQPLGQGDFDVAAFLETVIKAGYRGPIGIQCYGLKKPEDFLPRSHQAWLKIAASIR